MTLKTENEQQQPAVEKAVSFIIENIRLGKFVGGQRLIETDLREASNLGRGPLREALRILAGDGVVELIPNRGARVRRLDREDLAQVFEVVSGLNFISARICARRIDVDNNREIVQQAWIDLENEARLKDEARWYIAIGKFHNSLHQLTNNDLLQREYSRLRHVHFHVELANTLKVENWDNYVETYRTIAEAILTGDADLAGSTIITHVEKMIELLSNAEGTNSF